MFGLMSMLPWRHGLLAVAVLALAGGAYVKGRGDGAHQVNSQWAEERAAQTQAQLSAERAARAAEQTLQTKAQEATNAYATQARAARDDAAAARTQLDRLRDALGDTGPPGSATNPAAAPGGSDGAAAARLVVTECAGTLQEMAAAADDLEARLEGLQKWVRAVLGLSAGS